MLKDLLRYVRAGVQIKSALEELLGGRTGKETAGLVAGIVPTGPGPGWKWAGVYRQYLLVFTKDAIVPFELTSYAYAIGTVLTVVVVGGLVAITFLVTRLVGGATPIGAHSGLGIILWVGVAALALAAVWYGQGRVAEFTKASMRVRERTLLSGVRKKLLRTGKRRFQVSYDRIRSVRVDSRLRLSIETVTDAQTIRQYDFGALIFENTNLDIEGETAAMDNLTSLLRRFVEASRIKLAATRSR